MELVVEGNDQKLKVRIIGDVIADCCGELREAIMELGVRKPEEVVVDLKEVPFIDTSGLGVLVGLRTHMKKFGTTFKVANPQPRVMQVFRLTQLSKLFGLEN